MYAIAKANDKNVTGKTGKRCGQPHESGREPPWSACPNKNAGTVLPRNVELRDIVLLRGSKRGTIAREFCIQLSRNETVLAIRKRLDIRWQNQAYRYKDWGVRKGYVQQIDKSPAIYIPGPNFAELLTRGVVGGKAITARVHSPGQIRLPVLRAGSQELFDETGQYGELPLRYKIVGRLPGGVHLQFVNAKGKRPSYLMVSGAVVYQTVEEIEARTHPFKRIADEVVNLLGKQGWAFSYNRKCTLPRVKLHFAFDAKKLERWHPGLLKDVHQLVREDAGQYPPIWLDNSDGTWELETDSARIAIDIIDILQVKARRRQR